MCFGGNYLNEKKASWDTVPYYFEEIPSNIETEEVITHYYIDRNESDIRENEGFESEPKTKDDNKHIFTDTLLMALTLIGAIFVIKSYR